MTIHLDHTIVPARDKEASARFFARIFGLEYQGPVSHFAPVRINEQLTIDFDNWETFERHHYAFKVSDRPNSTASHDRVRGEGLAYGSGPRRGRQYGDQPSPRRAAAFISATRTAICSKC